MTTQIEVSGVQEGLKDYIVKEAVLAEDKRFERKRRTKQAKPPDAQLSIVLKVARSVYQELDFTATRENVLNLDCTYYNFNLVFWYSHRSHY